MGSTSSQMRRRSRTISLAKGIQRRLVDICAVVALCLLVKLILSLIGASRPPGVSVLSAKDRGLECERVGRADDETPISASHAYSPSGLLHVNPDGIHPILALIRSAEDEWDRKLDRASRTLEEAVREYKRRYRRDPPVGFDDWWDFSQEMEDQLPDEYDTIYTQLEPFWGMDPEDLASIQEALETRLDTFTISKNATHDTHLLTTAFSDPENWEQNGLLRGLDTIINLLDVVEPALQPFRAVFSTSPEPSMLFDYHVKKAFLDAALAKKYVNISDLPVTADGLGFASACPPGSPGRSSNISDLRKGRGRSFIHNHKLSMNPCQNPQLFDHHTHYVSNHARRSPQSVPTPLFSYSTTPVYHDIQVPFFVGWTADTPSLDDDPVWENKSDDRLLWRGNNVGMVHSDATRWKDSHRSRLVSWADDLNGTVDVLIPGNVEDEGWQRVGGGTLVNKALLSPTLLDVAFMGKPVGCDIQFCRHLQARYEWRKERELREREAGQHKFILDVDGKGPSSDFKKLISSNSLIFKATAYPEWWLDRSQPWVHYVPIQVDYSDLYDILLFFRGGLYGEDEHDFLAKRIALSGKEWSKTFWREEDMSVYLFRLFLEYSRVMSPDRDSKSYKPKAPDSWWFISHRNSFQQHS